MVAPCNASAAMIAATMISGHPVPVPNRPPRGATRHQLTAGGGRHTLDRSNDGPGQMHDLLHHIAARRHEAMEIRSAAVRIAAAAGEFLEVMSGAERRSIGSKHNRSNSVVGCDVTQGAGQRNQHRFRQTIADNWSVEDKYGNVLLALSQQDRSIHGDIRSQNIHMTHSPSVIPPNLNLKSIACKAWNVSAFPVIE